MRKLDEPPTAAQWVEKADASKIPNPDPALRPQIPPVGSHAEFPEGVSLVPYFLSFGARTGPTDADAEWLLSIVQRHPDRNVRITGMFWLVYFFNGGGPKQGPRSEVSRALRDRAAQILLEGMWSKDDIEREHAANAVGSARLWLLYPEFTDAFTHLRYDRVKLTRDYIEEALLNTNLHGYVKLE